MKSGPAVLRALVALAGVAALASFPSSAQAVVGPNIPGGYAVQVEIKFSGEAAPTGGVPPQTVHPVCWWEPANDAYTDAAASLVWYKEMTNGGQQTRDNIGKYGPISVWEDAVKTEENGGNVAWYHAYCYEPKDYERYDAGSQDSGGNDPQPGNPGTADTYYYEAFDEATGAPDPLVSSAELARVARDVMVIPKPTPARNPKIGTADDAPTLVGLPTWFWVDQQVLGGPDGAMSITAELGNVSATVTAKTEGLHLTSPLGSTNCDRAKAVVKYTGVGTESDASACTVQFDRAGAVNQVTASTHWDPTWTGSDDADGDDSLLPLDIQDTVNVPVAEVQNIVTR
jgi:hypothetical protein